MTSFGSYASRLGGDLSFADPSADPGGVVPAQRDARPPAAPELRLMAAVLAQAIDDDRRGARDGRPAAQRLRRKTRAWFASAEHDWPYSFERICAALDLDADAIRERLATASANRPAYYRRVTGPRRRSAVAPAEQALERRVA